MCTSRDASRPLCLPPTGTCHRKDLLRSPGDGEDGEGGAERNPALAGARPARDGDRPQRGLPAAAAGGRDDGGGEVRGRVVIAVGVLGVEATWAAVDTVIGAPGVQRRVGDMVAGRAQRAVAVDAHGLVARGDEPGAVPAARYRLVPDPHVVLVAGPRQLVAVHAAAKPPRYVLRQVAATGNVRQLG